MQSKPSLFLPLAGVFFGIVGNLAMCWVQWKFYKACSGLPQGTEIRPMGVAIHEFVVVFFGFAFVIPLSGFGMYYGIKQRRPLMWILSLIGILLGISPSPLGMWLGNKIISATGMVLEQ